MPFPAKNRLHPGEDREATSEGRKIPSPLGPRNNVMEFIKGWDTCYRFAFGVSCNPKEYPLALAHPAGVLRCSTQRDQLELGRWPGGVLAPLSRYGGHTWTRGLRDVDSRRIASWDERSRYLDREGLVTTGDQREGRSVVHRGGDEVPGPPVGQEGRRHSPREEQYFMLVQERSIGPGGSRVVSKQYLSAKAARKDPKSIARGFSRPPADSSLSETSKSATRSYTQGCRGEVTSGSDV